MSRPVEVFIQRSPKELMAATHIKCCKPRLREQIQLSIANSTSYIDIREKITSYERASKVWTNDQVLKHVNDQPNYASGSNDGPVPMEVDRVEKGKWKHKGKNKDRGSFGGSEWASGWLYGRGRGRGRTNKGKGKGKTKGKSNGKKGNQKGGSKGKAAEVKWLLGSAPIAWNLDIGIVTAPICLPTTWPRRIQEDKNLFLQTKLLLLRNPQQQRGESFSLAVHLPILHPQLLLLHCLRCAWFYFMIQIAIGQK
jgi:hypothetical protein